MGHTEMIRMMAGPGGRFLEWWLLIVTICLLAESQVPKSSTVQGSCLGFV